MIMKTKNFWAICLMLSVTTNAPIMADGPVAPESKPVDPKAAKPADSEQLDLSWQKHSDSITKLHKNGVVQIQIDSWQGQLEATTTELARALLHFPRASRFRVNWSAQVLGSTNSGSAFYHRNAYKIHLVSNLMWSRGEKQSRFLYLAVNDTVLYRLAQLNRDAGGGDDTGNFSSLVKLGVKQVTVKVTEESYIK